MSGHWSVPGLFVRARSAALAPAPKPAISVIPLLSADGIAAAQPGRDYVLRYDSQHAYETLTGKLRMLREWRVGRGCLLTGVSSSQQAPQVVCG